MMVLFLNLVLSLNTVYTNKLVNFKNIDNNLKVNTESKKSF